jgi:hypothetical protein
VLASYPNYVLMQQALHPAEIAKRDTEWLKEMGITLGTSSLRVGVRRIPARYEPLRFAIDEKTNTLKERSRMRFGTCGVVTAS